jgi:hypothetical protein
VRAVVEVNFRAFYGTRRATAPDHAPAFPSAARRHASPTHLRHHAESPPGLPQPKREPLPPGRCGRRGYQPDDYQFHRSQLGSPDPRRRQ